MIKLGTIDLNESLYLSGIDNANNIAISQSRTLGGGSVVQSVSLDGGRNFSLSTVNTDGSITGMWCQSQIDLIKEQEKTGVPILLIYRDRGTFNVLIISTNFQQYDQREPVHEFKKYTGSISMVEI